MIQFRGLGTKLFKNLISKFPLVSIERGTSSLKVVIAAREEGSLVVKDFLVEDLSPIAPEERTAYAKEKLAGFLKEKRIPAAVAFLLVEDEDFFSARVALPSLASKKEIRDAVSWEIKETMPFPEQEAVSDFHLIGETQKTDGSKIADMIYIALHKKAVDEAISLLDGLNLTLESVNIVPGSLQNILSQAAGFDDKQPVAILELGYNHTTISVFKEKKLIFTRRLSIGSSDITNSMLGVFSTNTGVVSLTYDDAEKIKKEYGIISEGQNIRIHNSEIASTRAISMMRPVLEKLIAEIKNSFTYLYEKTQEASVSKVYLTGGGSRLKNIDSFLNRQLGVPVEFFSVENIVPFSADIAPEKKNELPYLVSAIGAMLNSDGGFNFLPVELRTKMRETIEWILLRMTSVIVISVLLVSYSYISMAKFHYKRRGKSLKLNEATLQSLIQIKQEIDLMQSTVSAVRSSTIDGSLLLREISVRTPTDITLDSISYSESQGGGSLRLKGFVHGKQSDSGPVIAAYMKNLEDSLIFDNVNLASSIEAGSESEPVLNFTINCRIETH